MFALSGHAFISKGDDPVKCMLCRLGEELETKEHMKVPGVIFKGILNGRHRLTTLLEK